MKSIKDPTTHGRDYPWVPQVKRKFEVADSVPQSRSDHNKRLRMAFDAGKQAFWQEHTLYSYLVLDNVPMHVPIAENWRAEPICVVVAHPGVPAPLLATLYFRICMRFRGFGLSVVGQCHCMHLLVGMMMWWWVALHMSNQLERLTCSVGQQYIMMQWQSCLLPRSSCTGFRNQTSCLWGIQEPQLTMSTAAGLLLLGTSVITCHQPHMFTCFKVVC